mmetsp:Transcript_51118/g.118815  ORF Transcript_51118/g.118815 Transcript_51118/m.118815 type:complete len:441 (+) Transcript_51118:59-1381(+)
MMQQPTRRKIHQSHAWRSLFKKQFHKTKFCRYYNVGQCRYGTDCPFAHSQSELTIAPDLTKTTLCEAWLAGQCQLTAEQCQYAHGEGELRVTPVFGTSSLCKRRTSKEAGAPNADEEEPVQHFPLSVGLQGAPSWRYVPATADEAVPVSLGMSTGSPTWASEDSEPKGTRKAGKKRGGRRDKSAAVVHLAELLTQEAEQRKSCTVASTAAAATAAPWTAPGSPWPSSASSPLHSGVASSTATPQHKLSQPPAVPAPSHVPVPPMFFQQSSETDKLADLAALCASLADAQTATPGSLASASPMRWARTPSSAASPERTGAYFDRTPSPMASRTCSPRRDNLPAYVASRTCSPRRENLPAYVEMPVSPEARWARTPSTLTSPSVSPLRRVGGGLRVTHRGPPAADLHRLGSIFQEQSEPVPELGAFERISERLSARSEMLAR